MEKDIQQRMLSILINLGADKDKVDDYTKKILSEISFLPSQADVTPGFNLLRIDANKNEESASYKLGNIRFNLGTILEGVIGGVFSGASAVEFPWLIPFGVLLLIYSFSKSIKQKITEIDSVVLISMWENKDDKLTIKEEKILLFVNEKLHKFNRKMISGEELNESLNNLKKYNIIHKMDEEKPTWQLKEKIIIANK